MLLSICHSDIKLVHGHQQSYRLSDQQTSRDFLRNTRIVQYDSISPSMGLAASTSLHQDRRTARRNRDRGGQQVLPVGVLFRRRCIGCRTSAYQVVPTPCRRDSNPSGRGLVCRLMLPSPPRAYCPDDPSGNSAPRNSRRCSSQRYGLRRTTRSRTCLPFRSPTNIPKNPHTDNLGFHNHRRYFSLPSARYK